MSDAGGLRRSVEEELEKTQEAKRHIELKLRSLLQARLAHRLHVMFEPFSRAFDPCSRAHVLSALGFEKCVMFEGRRGFPASLRAAGRRVSMRTVARDGRPRC